MIWLPPVFTGGSFLLGGVHFPVNFCSEKRAAVTGR